MTVATPELLEVKGDRLVVHLHPGQEQVYNSKARFVAALAGTQGGKTSFAPIWLYREISRLGGGDHLAVTANYDMFKLKLLPALRDYFEHKLRVARYWSGERVLELAEDLKPNNFKASKQDDPMWGRIILRSAEAEAGLESATCQSAVVDEADHPDFALTAWEAIQRRLSINQGRALILTSLYHFGWVKHEIYDRWMDGDTDYDVVQFDSIANPSFPREEFERARRTMPLWKFRLLYQGKYEQPAGMIYDSFDSASCVIDPIPLPDAWPRYVGHDFGGSNPAAMFYAQDPATGYFYAYHEYLPGPGRSTAQHVEEFKRITQGVVVVKRAGGSHQEEEIRQGYAAHGWPIQEPKVHSVEAGIDRVYALHRMNKIFVFRGLRHYLDEKQGYSRKLDSQYNPTDEIADKAKYHLMDCERYILSDFTPETATRKTRETFYI